MEEGEKERLKMREIVIVIVWYIPGVARLFFSRAKFEDSLFGEGLKI